MEGRSLQDYLTQNGSWIQLQAKDAEFIINLAQELFLVAQKELNR